MGPLASLEKAIAGVYKAAPALPKNAKDWIVKYVPWLSLLAAIGSAWAAYAVWHWAHSYGALVDYLNQFSAYYSGTAVAGNGMSFWIWVGFIVLVVEAVIYLLAFQGLKATKKMGWNLLFWGSIVNVVYGIVIAFTYYGGFGNFIGAAIGTIVGWYFLFQIREYYLGKKVEAAAEAPKTE